MTVSTICEDIALSSDTTVTEVMHNVSSDVSGDPEPHIIELLPENYFVDESDVFRLKFVLGTMKSESANTTTTHDEPTVSKDDMDIKIVTIDHDPVEKKPVLECSPVTKFREDSKGVWTQVQKSSSDIAIRDSDASTSESSLAVEAISIGEDIYCKNDMVI